MALTGVTAAGHRDGGAGAQMLPRIRQHVSVPVGVGFGIRDAETAKALGAVADAVVIGSRLVQLLEVQPREAVAAAAGEFIATIRTALDEQPEE